MAPTPLVRMRRRMGFNPMMSVTEFSMAMSLVPTYRPTSPLAIVEIMTLGTPKGNPRMTALAIEVPLPPPMPRIPSIFPSRCHRATRAVAPAIMAASAFPRSPRSTNAWMLVPASRATSSRETPAAKAGVPNHARIDEQGAVAGLLDQPRDELRLRALRVQGTDHGDGLGVWHGHPSCRDCASPGGYASKSARCLLRLPRGHPSVTTTTCSSYSAVLRHY